MGLGGARARTVVAPVVGDLAVDHVAAPFALGDRRELREELVLAEEAALGGVGAVTGLLELARLDQDLAGAHLGGEPLRVLELGLRVGLAERGHGDGAVTQDVARDLKEKGAVHAARIRDQDAPHLGQGAFEGAQLVRGHGLSAPGAASFFFPPRHIPWIAIRSWLTMKTISQARRPSVKP